ncbi:MAG: FAD-dependent oxidoreductase [Actinomycetia bacterium]|nr:FAD-dependent oxidoreductase [Actinomycetes bacterium]
MPPTLEGVSGSFDVDAVVVGAGPAGATAALLLARAGKQVVLLERGPFPGSKNMYGGVIYGRILDSLIPGWYDEAPVQRWVTRRSTMMMTDTQALTIDYRTTTWGTEPYNGATAYRPDFDAWLADKAVEAGAVLLCSTTATGLLTDNGTVVGVQTDRPDGDLRAPIVLACDGVNSFLAKEAGLHHHHLGTEHFTLGAKETLAIPKDVIDQRFGVRGREGVDIEILGGTGAVAGGGFLYTNLDSVAVGVVLSLSGLGAQTARPEELIANLKAHPAIAPLVEGGEIKEYSAHLIPEGGYDAMPVLFTDGLLVAGDAGGMCLAAGVWLEGVNFAIGSGATAASVALDALNKDDCSAEVLASYPTRLEEEFVLRDHRKLRKAPGFVLSDRVQHQYPNLFCDLAEAVFTVTNPEPKRGMAALVRSAAKGQGVRLRDLVRDGLRASRIYG